MDQKSLLEELKAFLRELIESRISAISPKDESVYWSEHFKTLLTETDRRYEEKFNTLLKSINEAVNAAKIAIEKTELFSTKIECDSLSKKIDALESVRDIAQGKASQLSVLISAIVAAVSLLLSVLHYVIHMLK